MGAWIILIISFACIAGGILVGLLLRRVLPRHHLRGDTKDVIRLGTGLIGTIAALVLGLLIASAKSSFDTRNVQVKELIANVILLDSMLAQYGPDSAPARNLLRGAVLSTTEKIWKEQTSIQPRGSFEVSQEAFAFLAAVEGLSPKSEAQQSLKNRALQTTIDIGKTRLLLFAEAENSIPMPFLAILVFWLAIIFASFSLFAQPNAIAIGFQLVFALSAAAAIFLIVELGEPFEGLMQISNEPLRHLLAPVR